MAEQHAEVMGRRGTGGNGRQYGPEYRADAGVGRPGRRVDHRARCRLLDRPGEATDTPERWEPESSTCMSAVTSRGGGDGQAIFTPMSPYVVM